jgi:hypothetical protein
MEKQCAGIGLFLWLWSKSFLHASAKAQQPGQLPKMEDAVW